MIKNVSRFVKNVTVEPAVLLSMAAFVVVELTGVNLLIQKKCRFNATSEPDLSTPCDDEKQGIVFASGIMSYLRFIMYFLILLYAALAMSWSDGAGRCRKPLIMLPMLGLMGQSLCGCLHSYFWTWDPFKSALWNVIIEVACGGIILMIVASQAHLCDVSDVASRTMRLGLFSATKTAGDLAGFGSAGFVLRKFGFFYTYLICFVLSTVALVLAWVFVEDASVHVERKAHFCRVFNVMRIVDSFKIVFKKSLKSRRIIIVMLIGINVLVYFSVQGENSVQYLFLRHKFHWNEQDYSLYVIYRYIGVIIGNVFCSIVLSKLLKLHDAVIGALAGVWDTVAAVGYLFANQNWHLFVVPLFDVFHGAVLSVMMSFFSKFYEINELGRLSSVLLISSLVVPSCYPAYNIIFLKTLDFFPSAYFMLSIVINVMILLLYLSSYFLNKKLNKQESAAE
ncbi:proton-coupled folate transporter-like [Planococcus citri]|uniref:proton-coupled folate transporter-like n=1 Tax=Planococcus citri TaxID=170843 RepID=UPI0031F9EBC2